MLNGILNICYDAEHRTYFMSSNIYVKKIENTKIWWSGSEYQIEHTYEYKKGKLQRKDLKIFTLNVNENITIKSILLNFVND